MISSIAKAAAKTTILLFCITIGTSYAKEPINAYDYQKELTTYYNSGEYFADIMAQIKQAQIYLDQRVTENNRLPIANREKLAVVLDIDETSLSGYPCMQKISQQILTKIPVKDYRLFSWINILAAKHPTDFSSFCAGFPPIPGMVEFYNHAKLKNVAVFFLTGRDDSFTEKTIENLNSAGYKNWDGLFLRSNPYLKSSAAKFKSARRNEVIKKGYKIIIDIGDQYSDLAGGGFERGFKLPNPFYFIP